MMASVMLTLPPTRVHISLTYRGSSASWSHCGPATRPWPRICSGNRHNRRPQQQPVEWMEAAAELVTGEAA